MCQLTHDNVSIDTKMWESIYDSVWIDGNQYMIVWIDTQMCELTHNNVSEFRIQIPTNNDHKLQIWTSSIERRIIADTLHNYFTPHRSWNLQLPLLHRFGIMEQQSQSSYLQRALPRGESFVSTRTIDNATTLSETPRVFSIHRTERWGSYLHLPNWPWVVRPCNWYVDMEL